MPNMPMKVGEIEAVLDLLIAVEKKEQWLEKLKREKSPHLVYFPSGLSKTIAIFSEALPPVKKKPFKEGKK